MDTLKKASPALYGAVIICFLLPFITVSCSGRKVMTLTGIQLVTGASMGRQNMFGEELGRQEKEKGKIHSQPYAVAAFALALAGFAASLSRRRGARLYLVIMSAGGALCLLLLKTKLDQDIINRGQGLLEIDYGLGYWASFILFVLSAAVNGYLLKASKNGEPPGGTH